MDQIPDIVSGATCFFSPNAPEWAAIQVALNSGTSAYPNGIGHDPPCYLEAERQLLNKPSIGLNTDGSGAPAFILVRKRIQGDHAVIQIPD